jgi:hypothetical protein
MHRKWPPYYSITASSSQDQQYSEIIEAVVVKSNSKLAVVIMSNYYYYYSLSWIYYSIRRESQLLDKTLEFLFLFNITKHYVIILLTKAIPNIFCCLSHIEQQ